MFEALTIGLPEALRHYTGSYQVEIKCCGNTIKMSALNPSPIHIPAGEQAPLIIFTAKDESGNLWGPVYAWDYERETWMIFDERWHVEPTCVESSPVVEEVAVEEPHVEELKTPEPLEEMEDEDDDLPPSEDDDEDGYDWS